jgi:hypothetical protein
MAELLTRAIDELRDVEPIELTDTELHAFVVELQAQRARLGLVAAEAIAEWDRRGVWGDDGSLSAPHRLARDTRTALASARTEVRRARHCRYMPAARAAIHDGRFSLDHIDVFARAATPARRARFSMDEEFLIEVSAPLRMHQAVKAVNHWCQQADAADGIEPAPPKHAVEHARLHVSTTLDQTVAIDGSLDAIGGCIFTKELKRLERREYLADRALGVERSGAQRRAAALVEMATRSSSAPANGRRPAPLFTVLLGDPSFASLCELSNGTVLTPAQLAPWLSSALLETVLFDGRHTVISVSQRRHFVGALRRAIEVRDRHCQHPSGCDVPAEDCDVDHIVPRSVGGLTHQFTGRIECPPHNRDPKKHDHDAEPRPFRPISSLDHIRGRLRWRYQRDNADDADNADDDPDALGERDSA